MSTDLTHALMAVHLEMRGILGAVAREAGLTAQQIELMCVLQQHERPSFGQLAEMLGCDKTNITGMADRLARRELVAREADPVDRRITRLRLTEEGRAFAARLKAAVVNEVAERSPSNAMKATFVALSALKGTFSASGPGTG